MKQYAYKGELITANSKREAIHKIISSSKLNYRDTLEELILVCNGLAKKNNLSFVYDDEEVGLLIADYYGNSFSLSKKPISDRKLNTFLNKAEKDFNANKKVNVSICLGEKIPNKEYWNKIKKIFSPNDYDPHAGSYSRTFKNIASMKRFNTKFLNFIG